MAAGLGCAPGEVVFTSGGTEADNLAITGVVARSSGTARCSAIEHHAVLHAVEAAGGHIVPVDANGVIDLDLLAASLDREVAVVSVMLANNEVGTVEPLGKVAEVVRQLAPRAALHTDAVQAFSWLDVASACSVADLVSVAAHKFGGPQGVGALVVRDGTTLEPMLLGGGQERDRRSGTHNVAGIVGMAAAVGATIAARARDSRARGEPAPPFGDDGEQRAGRRPADRGWCRPFAQHLPSPDRWHRERVAAHAARRRRCLRVSWLSLRKRCS